MEPKKSLINNLSDKHKKIIQKLSTDGLTRVLKNREIALEYARKGILQSEPEKLTDDYVELVADSMQILARIVLEERKFLK